jgi:hypothetical protein
MCEPIGVKVKGKLWPDLSLEDPKPEELGDLGEDLERFRDGLPPNPVPEPEALEHSATGDHSARIDTDGFTGKRAVDDQPARLCEGVKESGAGVSPYGVDRVVDTRVADNSPDLAG